MRSGRVLCLTALVTSVGGCSSSYHIRATVIDGTLAFVADSDMFGNPGCIRSILVESEEGTPAQPAPGDDVEDVHRGVYWKQTFASPSCENTFPVKYGAKLSGPVFIYSDGKPSVVEAKALTRGVAYNVSAESSGSAYGGGKFRISDDGHIINLPR